MTGASDQHSSRTPDSGEASRVDDQAEWDEADEAMCRLLEAAFANTELTEGPSPAFHLTSFLPETPTSMTSRLPEKPPPPGAPPGRMFGVGEMLGRFRIEGELGRGGFGVVYRAIDTHLGRTVAIKTPRPDRVQSVALWDRLAREARLVARLDHDAIVPVLDAGLVDGVFVLVSAIQEGEPLSRWLASRHPAGVPPRFAASLALRMAAGLRHAHGQGVLHRDLKPANVIMVPVPDHSEEWSPRITDFGLGTLHEEGESATLTGFWQGSPPYVAPEQVMPEIGRVDARSDIYALGAILYELVTGRPIYPCTSLVELSVHLSRRQPPLRPRRLRPGLPVDLETICLKCLERDPTRRYPSAADLQDDLERFLDGRPVLARPIPAWARLGRWARRRPSQAALIALATLTAVVTAGLVIRHDLQIEEKNLELTRSNRQLQDTLTQRDVADSARKAILERLYVSERKSRRTAFTADLRLAERELAAGRVEVVQALLQKQVPAKGEEDLRDFTWHYLMRQASRLYSIHPLKDLRWWRGGTSVTATFDGLDRPTRDHILGSLTRAYLGRDEIRGHLNASSFVLGSKYLGFTSLDERGNPTSTLQFNDGRHRIALGVEAGTGTILGPRGRVLVSNLNWVTEAEKTPPLVPTGDFNVVIRDHAEGTGLPSVVPYIVAPVGSSAMSFSSDGRTLACLATTFPETRPGVRPLLYDLNSGWVASYPQYETLSEFMDVRSRDRKIENRLVLSRDGRLTALGGDLPRLRVFESRTGRSLWSVGPETIGADAFITSLAFSEESGALVTGDSRGQVRVWDAMSGRLVDRFPVDIGYVTNVAFHPDDRTVAIIGSYEDAIRFWDLVKAPEPPTDLDHGDEVWDLTFLDQGKSLASVGDDYQVQVWDPATGILRSRRKESDLLSAVSRAGPGRPGDMAVVGFAGEISVLSARALNDGPAARFSDLAPEKLRTVAWSPDGETLVAGGDGEKVLVVSWQGSASRTRIMATPFHNVYSLAFSPDGRTLAMGSHDRAITLWDVAEFRHVATLPARAPVACVAYSPDGTTLISSDIEGGLQIWSMPAGTLRTTLVRASEPGGVWALAFSPDGKVLATGGDDRMVRLWDPVLGVERLALSGHEAKVHAVAFSPDGKTLASGDFKGKIRLWRSGP